MRIFGVIPYKTTLKQQLNGEKWDGELIHLSISHSQRSIFGDFLLIAAASQIHAQNQDSPKQKSWLDSIRLCQPDSASNTSLSNNLHI